MERNGDNSFKIIFFDKRGKVVNLFRVLVEKTTFCFKNAVFFLSLFLNFSVIKSNTNDVKDFYKTNLSHSPWKIAFSYKIVKWIEQ